jgi:hypothetical protein
MKFLNKLERKFGRYAIKNLMIYIVVLNLVVYLMSFIDPTLNYLSKLYLIPQLVLQGEVWRLVTFIFIPPTFSMIWIIFTLYFYYMIGNGLEQEWGSFKFNIYYILGVVGTIIGAFLSGGGITGFYLNLSLFLAFAYIYPNFQILLFFVLPVKMKYLAWLDALYLGWLFFSGSKYIKLAIAAAMLNFLIFFGKDIFYHLKNNRKTFFNKKSYQQSFSKKDYFHKCTTCGLTDRDNKELEFRYCPACEKCFCTRHLKDHTHTN